MIDAGVAANVKLFIFSSLPSFEHASNGTIRNVHHCMYLLDAADVRIKLSFLLIVQSKARPVSRNTDEAKPPRLSSSLPSKPDSTTAT